jgi:hypothetical protein
MKIYKTLLKNKIWNIIKDKKLIESEKIGIENVNCNSLKINIQFY